MNFVIRWLKLDETRDDMFSRNMPGPQKKKKLYLCLSFSIAALNKLYMMHPMKLNIFQYNKISFIQP